MFLSPGSGLLNAVIFASLFSPMFQDFKKGYEAKFANVWCDTAVPSMVVNSTINIPLDFIQEQWIVL